MVWFVGISLGAGEGARISKRLLNISIANICKEWDLVQDLEIYDPRK